jgi:hypothetical protein
MWIDAQPCAVHSTSPGRPRPFDVALSGLLDAAIVAGDMALKASLEALVFDETGEVGDAE